VLHKGMTREPEKLLKHLDSVLRHYGIIPGGSGRQIGVERPLMVLGVNLCGLTPFIFKRMDG